jgi:hypothetical protein
LFGNVAAEIKRRVAQQLVKGVALFLAHTGAPLSWAKRWKSSAYDLEPSECEVTSPHRTPMVAVFVDRLGLQQIRD